MNKSKNQAFIKRNKVFAAASKEEKRILIIKDALGRILAEKIKPVGGDWVRLNKKWLKERETQVCDILENESCKCCALGSLMVGEIRNTNNLTVEEVTERDYWGDGKCSFFNFKHRSSKGDRLNKYFSAKQLEIIEVAFELGQGHYDVYDDQSIMALKFGKKFKSRKKRLVAILQNMLANKGIFKPQEQ